jgi:hypothetical protein
LSRKDTSATLLCEVMSKGYVAKREVGHKPEGEPTQLYQRAGRKGSRTTHYVPASAFETKRRAKGSGIRPKLSKERAQADKVLRILEGMADTGPRRSAGIRSIAGRLFSYVARGEHSAIDDAGLRGWLEGNAHSFPDDIEETIAIARQEACRFLPTPREIGDATGYTNQEWDDDGCPAFVWPCDIRSDVEIAGILAAIRREKDATRKREARERNGARPHVYSKAALARFYGVHVETVTAMLADGRLHPHTGDRIDPATGEVIRCFRPEPKEALSRKRTKSTVGACGDAPVGPAPAGFSPAELSALAATVDIGLRDASNAVELPGRKAALARLMELAAQAFAPKQASNDRVSAPVGSANKTAGETGETFGKAERGSPSAGPAEPTQANRQEVFETMTARADTTDTTEPIEPAPCAPVRSRRDWHVAIQKLNRALVEPDLYDAERIVLEDERAELVAGFRAAFPAPEQAAQPGSASGRTKAAGAASAAPGAATARERPTTYSAPSYRRARA